MIGLRDVDCQIAMGMAVTRYLQICVLLAARTPISPAFARGRQWGGRIEQPFLPEESDLQLPYEMTAPITFEDEVAPLHSYCAVRRL